MQLKCCDFDGDVYIERLYQTTDRSSDRAFYIRNRSARIVSPISPTRSWELIARLDSLLPFLTHESLISAGLLHYATIFLYSLIVLSILVYRHV